MSLNRFAILLLLAIGVAGCGTDSDDDTTDADIFCDVPSADEFCDADADNLPSDPNLRFGVPGPLVSEEGRGSFRFGAASAATQIEDQNPNTDWWYWVLPEEEGGAGKGREPIGRAVEGYSRAIEDVELVSDTHLDSYRFSVEWARIEPERGRIDRDAIAHYRAQLEALVAAGIRPMITVYHFSNPIWVNDFLAGCPEDGPADDNLCGWAHPQGRPLIIEALADHTALLAREFGDLVDDWCTINEPVNYIIAAYGAAVFPPGEFFLLTQIDRLLEVFKGYIQAHVAMVDAIREHDTVDADGDGRAADIGFTLNVADWVPARDNRPSTNPADLDATLKVRRFYHELFTRAVLTGEFDSDLDGEPDELHEDWAGHLDWLGIQYYFRAGVTAKVTPIPLINGMICYSNLDFGSCLPPEDPTWWVPTMSYEYWAPGIASILIEMSEFFPGLPMVVTEAGIATEVGERRAENIVRTLEQLQVAMDAGVDLRGYYYWSLTDNFEWAEGYGPRFGLWSVDYETMERSATMGQQVLATVARDRVLSEELRELYGGLGPMTPE